MSSERSNRTPVVQVAISGKLCAGKTSLANMLCEVDDRFERLSFAAPIYELAREYLGMEGKNRDWLIRIGEAFREIDPDVWINYLIKRGTQMVSEGKSVIVDDARFPREVAALKNAGFYVVRLDIDVDEQARRIRSTYPNDVQAHMDKRDHATECALDLFDDWSMKISSSDTLDVQEIYNNAADCATRYRRAGLLAQTAPARGST